MTEYLDSYHELFERSPDAILIMEGDHFVDCNPSAVRMLRFSSRAALLDSYAEAAHSSYRRSHPAQLSPPRQPDGRDSFEKAQECLQITFERGSHTFEWVHTCADGEPILVEVQLTVARQDPEPILHCVWRDISERKQQEAELQRSQRLEAIGRLASGVAHDFNNMLMVVLGHAEQLEDEFALGAPDPEHVSRIRSAADRAAALTQQLLGFSRGQPTQAKPTDMGRLLDDLDSLLRRLIGKHIELQLTRVQGCLTVLAEPNQLEQLIVNLAANAHDAMPEGGRLLVALGRQRVTSRNSLAKLPPGEYVTLTVTDSGTGMSAEQLDRAFEPFFTTKPLGRGTGLGLATVHAVAKQNGGYARMESELGRGTTVQVLLPLCDRAATRHGIRPALPNTRRGEETILLVEDEDAIRSLFALALASHGYTVLTASDGQEALDRFKDVPDGIDILITNMVMPRLSGPELVQRLSATWPDLCVLYMSGYSAERSFCPIPQERLVVLQKPFSPKLLRVEVRRLLDQRAAVKKR